MENAEMNAIESRKQLLGGVVSKNTLQLLIQMAIE